MCHKEKPNGRMAVLLLGLAAVSIFGAGQTINVPQRSLAQQATVSIIKDDAVNYSSMVSQALEAALGPGGISNLVGPGKTVLIKPNLVTNNASAVTDWRMVKALVDQIKAVNGGAAITIAEGSASNSGTSNTRLIMAAQGFTDANFPGVALVDLNDINECPTNNFVLADGASDNPTKQVAERIYQADVYINCPKMKTHYHAGYTGALKNIGIGTPSWTLWNTPGTNTNKGGLHNDIRREILDHNLVRVPDLTLMDAIQPMEGQGPASGTSVTMNLILASRDPVALDVVACNIMKIPPYLITHIPLCANENIGVMDMNKITVTGNITIDAVKRAFVRATPGAVTPPYELAAIPYRATTVIRTAPAAVTVDGNLIEWGCANQVTVDSADQVKSGNSWNGPSDCSLKAKLMWDVNNLYIAAYVRDNIKLNNTATGSSIVNGDGIELYISTYPKQYDATVARGTSYMTEYDHRIAISYAQIPQAWMISQNRDVAGFSASKVETSDGYIIEAKIPWNSLNNFNAGRYQQIGLNVAINDADVNPASVNKKLYWNAANQSDVETNTQKLGISYLDPAGGIYGTDNYTLNVSALHGTVTKYPDLPSYNSFSTVTLTATPENGYSFAGWSGDISGMANPVTVVLDNNRSATATFANSSVLTSIVITPSNTTVNTSSTTQFSAVGYDQSGNRLSPQPSFTWSANGVGSISSGGLFTAGTTVGTSTITASSGNVNGTATVIVVSATQTLYKINCGSNSAVSPFTADQFASGGTMRTITDVIDLSGVTDPAPQAIYQSERYGTQTYTIPNLTSSSTYKVRLHMAELYQTAVGKRVFNVAINGSTVLSNFDIFAITGVRFKAIVREFTTVANSSGQIIVTLTTITDNATISGIEIVQTTPNAAPTIATTASAAPSPVAGTSAVLSVLGADDNGESNLTYTWATSGTVPAAVTFSANGNNAAKTTTATFTKAGNYAFVVTVKDAGNLTATSTVNVVVNQTFSSIVLSPSNASVNISAAQQFTASAQDQFGAAMNVQPSIVWSVNGGGVVSSSGLFIAGTVAGSFRVTATSGTISASVPVTVTQVSPVAYQINCGSNSAVSPFTADQYVSGGTMRTITNTIDLSGVSNPAPQAVYQSERYGTQTYTIPNLAASGQYTVRLHMAELYQTAVGKRVFNVAINGSTVLSNFDIFAITGARYKAIVREFTATANSSGQIIIALTTVTDNATISGIEIIATTSNSPPFIISPATVIPNPLSGTTATLTVLGSDDNGESNLTYTWATSGTVPAPVTYSVNGNNAANTSYVTFTKAGNYTFVVTVKDAGNLSVTGTVSVTVNQSLTSITLSPANATVNTSGTQQFTATALDQFGNTMAVQPSFTWNVNGGGSVSSNGLFTAGTSVGSYVVTAANGGVSANAPVTIVAVNTPPIIVSPATVLPSQVAGTTAQLAVLGADDNGEANLTYTWTTSGTVPGTVTYNPNGINAANVSTVTFTKAGNYTFVVTVKDAGNLTVTSTANATVNQVLTSITLSPLSATVNTNATRQFTATALDQFGNTMTTQPSFTWSVNGGGTVSSNGLFTAGSTAGTFTVTVTSGTITATASVIVSAVNTAPTIATAASATPNPVTAKTAALSVLGADDNGESNLTYTWATSGTVPAAVSFSVNGNNAAKATTATFTKAGSYTLIVTVKDAGNLTVTSTVSVTVNQTLTLISITPSTVTVSGGATQQFIAAATDQFGSAITAPSLSWTVSGGGTISTSGLFTAGTAAGGPYTVTAKSGSITGTAQVTIQVSSGVVIYGEALNSDYANYSWSTTCNFSDASPVKVGSKSLAVTYSSGWAGLLFQRNSGAQTHTGFTGYSFWAHGGTSGTRQVQFFTRNSSGAESKHVTVSIPANTWTQINVTLSSLGNPADAKAILMQECSGSAQQEFNIDQLELK